MLRATLSCWMLLGMAAPLSAETLRGVVRDPDGNPVPGARVAQHDMYRPTAVPSEPATTTTDEEGRFEFPRSNHVASSPSAIQVMAYKPGWAIRGSRIDLTARSPHGIELTLQRPREFTVRLVDPEGHPLGQTELKPHAVSANQATMRPDFVLPDSFSFPTNSDGTFQIDFLGAESWIQFAVETEAWGTQFGWVSPDVPHRTVRLRGAGRLVGKLVGEQLPSLDALPLIIRTMPARTDGTAPSEQISTQSATAEVSTDAEGRFEIPALAEGTIQVELAGKFEHPLRIDTTIDSILRAGETLEIEIPVVRAIPVRGKVVDRATKDPLPGIAVNVVSGQHRQEYQSVVTDDHGQFHSYAVPGPVRAYVRNIPAPYIQPIGDSRQGDAAPDTDEFTFDAFELERGVSRLGTVVNEEGKPVEGAQISASWEHREGSYLSLRFATSESDATGQFKLEPLREHEQLRITAASQDRAMRAPLMWSPDAEDPLRLELHRDGVVVLSGRVLDPDGHPISEARVMLLRRSRGPGGQIFATGAVPFAGRNQLVTNQHGQFQTPHPIPRFDSYSLRIEADGFLRSEIDQLELGTESAAVELPSITLVPRRTLAGIVEGTDGQPVAGVTVMAWSSEQNQAYASTTTQDDGRFRLEGMHPQAWFVVADAPEYRISGQWLPSAGESVRIVVRREDEPAPVDARAGWREPGGERRPELLTELLKELYASGKRLEEPYWVSESLRRLAPLDPEFVLPRVEEVTSLTRRVPILLALGQTDEALAVAETIDQPYSRTFQYLAAATQADDPDRQVEILGAAYGHAQTEQDPARRVVLLAKIAETLLDLAQTEAAENILREALPTAQELAGTEWSGFAGTFAELLGLFDLEAALKLMPSTTDDPRAADRHVGNLAHRLAGIDPEQSERLVRMLSGEFERGRYAVRACYRMAPVDLPRARTLADLAGVEHQALAYGVMAQALAESQSEQARALVREGFARLASGSTRPYSQYFLQAAALFLYTAELAPDAVDEYLWQTIALHSGPESSHFPGPDRQERQDGMMSRLLALIALDARHAEQARHYMEPIFQRHTDPAAGSRGYEQEAVFAAMVLSNPERSTQLALAYLRDPPEEGRTRIRPEPLWTTVANYLAATPEEIRNDLLKRIYHGWVIDDIDL